MILKILWHSHFVLIIRERFQSSNETICAAQPSNIWNHLKIFYAYFIKDSSIDHIISIRPDCYGVVKYIKRIVYFHIFVWRTVVMAIAATVVMVMVMMMMWHRINVSIQFGRCHIFNWFYYNHDGSIKQCTFSNELYAFIHTHTHNKKNMFR